MPRCVVVHDDFDWGDDRRLRTRWRDTVIYELHVKGFTALHDEIPEHLRGTYAGLGSRAVIDYLNDLGVTAVELLPVHQFVTEPGGRRARADVNYWGYNSIGFFAPHAAYSSSGDRGQQVTEFKQMVKNFHAAGHRGDPRRGLQPHRRGRRRRADVLLPRAGRPRLLQAGRRRAGDAYWDVTGCGNTVDADQPRGAAADPRLAALLGQPRCTSTASASTSPPR